MPTILRITRHPAVPEKIAALQEKFGAELKIVEQDLRYGDDPVAAVKDLLATLDNPVAVELSAPMPVLIKLLDARLPVLLLRAEPVRENGRAVVIGQDENGRDIFQFSHYEVLKRIVFETERL